MKATWVNYWLMGQFIVMAIVWVREKHYMQCVYWLGGFLCTAIVTFK